MRSTITVWTPRWIPGMLLALAFSGCETYKTPQTRFCFEENVCVEPGSGTLVDRDGNPLATDATVSGQSDVAGDGGDAAGDGGDSSGDGSDATTSDNGDSGDGGDAAGDGGDGIEPTVAECTCPLPDAVADSDNDCLEDSIETGSGRTSPIDPDSDDDGILDGCEDQNRDGICNAIVGTDQTTTLRESCADNADSDGDGVPDGVEDSNQNGTVDAGETSPRTLDTDSDGIPDGIEDQNQNGVWDGPQAGVACLEANAVFESDPTHRDTDGDGILDGLEDRNQNGMRDADETFAYHPDTDCDGVGDGAEDSNRNGVFNAGEMDPRSPDTDGDTLADGLEDSNRNGAWDPGLETDPLRADTDLDGLLDQDEDRNGDGRVAAFVDANSNGCWDNAEEPGETDPRLPDSDGDGILDGIEDADHNGECNRQELPDPLNPSQTQSTLLESCGFVADSDCDGLVDGREDADGNGRTGLGETNPRRADSDFDGLADGCGIDGTETLCEDRNGNGVVDNGETDPAIADTDGDNLPDGCEVLFGQSGPQPSCDAPPCGTDPNLQDTDGDGIADGDEDLNRDCQVNSDETDPRVFDQPPAPQDPGFSEWSVCANQNLKRISYASSSRRSHDYRLAFEIETNAEGDEARYLVAPIGRDASGDETFLEEDPGDVLLGHIFQSPAGILTDDTTNPPTTLHRNVYGFITLSEDPSTTDTFLDTIREDLEQALQSVTEVGAVTARETHDSLPHFLIRRGQRQIEIETAAPTSALALRNMLLRDVFLQGQATTSVLPEQDPIFGNIECPGNPRCHSKFSLYVAAVQREDQPGPSLPSNAQPPIAQPVFLTIVALTPNETVTGDPASRANAHHDERLVRLEDLTGGGSLARFAAETGKECEPKDQAMAQADLLWVVDDSRSMQQIIGRLQQAAADAQAVLTANSGIVDFRVAMTTTNPLPSARTACPAGCDRSCDASPARCSASLCQDATLGCLKLCPEGCSNTCTDDGAPSSCVQDGTSSFCSSQNGCFASIEDAYSAELSASVPGPDGVARDYRLPGAAGSFYHEDSLFLDCDSSSTSGSTRYINSCEGAEGFEGFFDGNDRKILAQNGGFLGSSPEASCSEALMDLSSDAELEGTSCLEDSDFCCARLLEACPDGPRVLASQMCDLIRSMGGLPSLEIATSGSRPNSGPEHGVRSARKLLSAALPALPQGHSGAEDASQFLRLRCQESETDCVPCDPRVDAECNIVPTAVLFLSDEEDYFFKDECRLDQSSGTDHPGADRDPLPDLCRYGRINDAGELIPAEEPDPTTSEICTPAYCDAQNYNTEVPEGYNPHHPDAEPGSLKWRSDTAAACSADPADMATSCVGDPCPHLSETQCAGDGITEPLWDFCLWDAADETCRNSCNRYSRCTAMTRLDLDCTGSSEACNQAADLCDGVVGCQWEAASSVCRDTNPDLETLKARQSQCEVDPACRWRQELVRNDQELACQPAYDINDCRACKRLRRHSEAVAGGPDAIEGGALVGFDAVGPVYAIARERGAQGQGGLPEDSQAQEDECGGGLITWGRGDGLAYRDLAIATLGRTQNVCADSYREFMQRVIADLATLSAPYPLQAPPIPTTIKVGIQRPLAGGGGSFEFIDVPRSRSRGFFFDATPRASLGAPFGSLGFKSDPIDGQCADGEVCAQDGVIQSSEIAYARIAPSVPRAGDTLYISYRLWRPVPCLGTCEENQTCARLLCLDEGPSGEACTASSECSPGSICSEGACQLDCTPGELIDACVASVECGVCERFEDSSQSCVAITDTCACQTPGSQVCIPGGQETCPTGTACQADTCSCAPICPSAFDALGNPISCQAAETCCADLAACPTLDALACASREACSWDGATCLPAGPQSQCCGGDALLCTQDLETGDIALECRGSCSCEGAACPGGDASFCESWQSCVNDICTPACEPTEQICDTTPSGACQCIDNPT